MNNIRFFLFIPPLRIISPLRILPPLRARTACMGAFDNSQALGPLTPLVGSGELVHSLRRRAAQVSFPHTPRKR